MSKEMKFKGKQTPKLGKGKFIIKVGVYDAIVIQAYDFLIGKHKAYYLNKDEHRQRLNQNLRDYYTKSKPKSTKAKTPTNQTQKPSIPVSKIESIL